MLLRFVSAAVIAATVPAAALAQSSAGVGAVGGCVTGAIIGGPVGAVIGCALGAAIGVTIVPPPAQVVTYVTAQPPPAAVVLQGDLVVGATLPEAVVLYPVPADVFVATTAAAPAYSYAFVNGKRVVVDSRTRAIVAIVN
jgi:hypothetical protein